MDNRGREIEKGIVNKGRWKPEAVRII